MARTQYCVVLHRRQWNIRLNGGYYGPYPSRGAAIEAAMEAAQENGRDSQVLVQDDDEKLRTVWTFDTQPFLLSA